MTTTTRRVVRWALVALGVAAAMAATAVDAGEVGFTVGFASFLVVGAVIVAKRPDQPIGWLFAAGATLALVGSLAEAIIVRAIAADTLATAAARAAIWMRPVYFFPAIALVVVFPALLFPTGRLLTPRWRWTVWLLTAGIGGLAVDGVVSGETCIEYSSATGCARVVSRRPGIAGWESGESALAALAIALVMVALVGTVVAAFLRFRRSSGAERAQLKWFALAIAIVGLVILTVSAADAARHQIPFAGTLFGLALALIPASVGIALLRYRLYEIDRVINRTLVYGLVVGALGGVFAGGVTLASSVLPLGSTNVGVAGSTVAVAALFNPLRRRVQRVVDRRFYRSAYDPDEVASGLSTRLRDVVEPVIVGTEWADVVTETMRPESVGVWLRSET